eukprot:gene29284-12527_t
MPLTPWYFPNQHAVTPEPQEPAKPEMSEREVRSLRRKQANRDSARKSKLRKKVEVEQLSRKKEELCGENVGLRAQLTETESRVTDLQSKNSSLKEQIQAYLNK